MSLRSLNIKNDLWNFYSHFLGDNFRDLRRRQIVDENQSSDEDDLDNSRLKKEIVTKK